MEKTYFLNQSTALIIVITICFIFAILGINYSKKFKGINNYLTANRNIGFFFESIGFLTKNIGFFAQVFVF